MEKVNLSDIPYGAARIRKDFSDLFVKLFTDRYDSDKVVVSDAGSENFYKFKHNILPFEVSFFEHKGEWGSGMVYFDGEGWRYKIAYIARVPPIITRYKIAYISRVPPIITHKGAFGDMDRMVEDLITAKLTL